MRRKISVIAIVVLVACLVVADLLQLPWFIAGPLALLIGLPVVAAAWPYSGRRITPQEWAGELESHLRPGEGAYDWDDATSAGLADERLEALRGRLVPEFDRLETPEKREQLRQIIDALRRGEVPSL